MARAKSEWAAKVLALVKAGNVPAAIAQIKVAPTVGDVERLQALLAALPASAAMKQLHQVVEEERALLAAPRLHRSP
ncbi:hypothetical protein B2J88_35230 [Rhodococcus sp. SRB_17]|uniref:hypothetical protein n=1 Tax=Acidovorax sp. SRB_24 TaxID=1962700 RepID=UPI00145E89EE|nr:hypothetical protein [Acidovorax sp. SRB_24]NMM78515.1 hypothetical protein [Acidovorax sp. SRB_24]NMM89538.1 hypothetical protein [Rhodococcus sp. SRB_17]